MRILIIAAKLLPWIPEPSRRFNLLFTAEGTGIQGTKLHVGVQLQFIIIIITLFTHGVHFQNVLFHGAVHIKNIYIILLQLQITITTKNHNTKEK
jgi:hypothetical protein